MDDNDNSKINAADISTCLQNMCKEAEHCGALICMHDQINMKLLYTITKFIYSII